MQTNGNICGPTLENKAKVTAINGTNTNKKKKLRGS
jgi:hypothetical protein